MHLSQALKTPGLEIMRYYNVSIGVIDLHYIIFKCQLFIYLFSF